MIYIGYHFDKTGPFKLEIRWAYILLLACIVLFIMLRRILHGCMKIKGDNNFSLRIGKEEYEAIIKLIFKET